MKEDEKRKFISSLRQGGRSRFGFKDIDIEIVNGNDARGDTRWKTWERLRMMGGHGGGLVLYEVKINGKDATS